jgi:hypothetical protein
LKEEVRYKLEIIEREEKNEFEKNSNNFDYSINEFSVKNPDPPELTVKVIEIRKIRGVFYERLELYDFPMDMQELSVTLTSKLSVDEVELTENKVEPCSVNTAEFLDQQVFIF